MSGFKKGDKPGEGLTTLKKYMEDQISKIEKAGNDEEKDQLFIDTLSEYNDKMGSLSTIYNSKKERNDTVEQLIVEVRNLYQPLRDQFNQKHPLKLVEQVQEELDEKRRQREEQQRKQLEEKQRKPEPELESQSKQHQEETINNAIKKIDDIIVGLTLKIDRVDQHQYKKAHDAANALLINLIAARDEYQKDLRENIMSQEVAGSKFKSACKEAIKDAKPVLEKDLGWGDYLTNLLKTLANAVVTVVTFGQYRGFFTYVRPESVKAVEKAEQDLELDQVVASHK